MEEVERFNDGLEIAERTSLSRPSQSARTDEEGLGELSMTTLDTGSRKQFEQWASNRPITTKRGKITREQLEEITWEGWQAGFVKVVGDLGHIGDMHTGVPCSACDLLARVGELIGKDGGV